MAKKQKFDYGKIAIAVLAVVALGMVLNWTGIINVGQASVTADLVDADGEPIAPWANKLVPYNLLVSDAFLGTDVDATVKVFEEKPSEWLNTRADFDESSEYTIYTASSGVAEIIKEMPGHYYAVLEKAGMNTLFLEFDIPDGTGRGDISDYSTSPDSALAEMTQVGTTTSEDIEFTLTNQSDAEESEFVALEVAEDTEFHAWKAVFKDIEGFSLDSDSDGIYDEGYSSISATIAGKTVELFNPDKGIDLFDSNDEYTLLLEGVVVADKADLIVTVEFVADTLDGNVVANDEKASEGEGIIMSINIFNDNAVVFATVNAVA